MIAEWIKNLQELRKPYFFNNIHFIINFRIIEVFTDYFQAYLYHLLSKIFT